MRRSTRKVVVDMEKGLVLEWGRDQAGYAGVSGGNHEGG
jgi:hypothetical protein